MDWQNYLGGIENPNEKPLKELLSTAREGVIDQLQNDGAEVLDNGRVQYKGSKLGKDELNKFAYTFYFDWENDEDPDYVFLVQNPGRLITERHLDHEAEELIEAIQSNDPYISQVRKNREYLYDWLWSRNSKFSEGFFSTLEDYGLIEIESVEKYLEGEFYSDFVLTDLVKYRVQTGEISGNIGGNAELSFQEYLLPELKAYDPELVFLFGSRNWKTFLGNMDLEPVTGSDGILVDTISNTHGHLYEAEGMHFLPLNHFSGRNTFLRNSYFDYMEDGLKAFSKV